MWEFCYKLMCGLPSRFLQRKLWRLLRNSGLARLMCEEGYLKLQLLGITGEVYSLTDGGINSWILWQRLNFRSPLVAKGCDKYAVRELVRERIGERYLTPLVAIDGRDCWTDPAQIDFDKLPRQFVLKLNNGSGMNMIVKDKSGLDWEKAVAVMRGWMRSDYSKTGHEWQYRNVPNKIICEELIPTPNGEPPSDYKIMCNDGRPLYIWVDTARFTDHRRNVFGLDWRDEGVRIGYRRGDAQLPRPANLDLMIELAERMSKGIPMVRVDFYNVGGRIYFGELTFTSDRGLAVTTPFSFSQAMARKVVFLSDG